jgi:hypothetical protein
MLLKRSLVAFALGLALLAPVAASAQSRPPAIGYSGLFWPNYSLWGRKASRKTKFGVLVCEGAGYKGHTQRYCYWK